MRHNTAVLFLFILLLPLKAQNKNDLYEVIQKFDFQPNCISINNDNTKMLIGGENEKVYLLDLNNNKVENEWNAHYQPVINVYFSKIDNGFYTVGDRSFKFWQFNTEEPDKIYTGTHTNVTDWTFSKDEELFVAGSYEKRFRVWQKGQFEEPLTIETTQKKNIISVAISPDKKSVAAGSLDSTIELWDITTQKKKTKILAHSGPVCCLSFIKNGKYLISSSHDGYAKLWNSETGDNIKNYPGKGQAINAIAVSPDEKFLLAGTWDGFICLFAIATGDLIYQFNYHTSPVWDLCWNKEGNGFYSCEKNGDLVNWKIPKQLYVEHFYGKEFEEEISNNKMFSPKRKNESRDDYKRREVRAEKAKKEIIDKYYKLILNAQNLE